MKNTKVCPKCSQTDIVVISNDGHPDGTYGNNIQTGATILSGSIFIKRYVCCSCGYTEEWIELLSIFLSKGSIIPQLML